jgi:hypothetical protein
VNENSEAIDIYKRLGVRKDSSSQVVHKHFLKLVISLLQKIKGGQKSDQLMTELKTLWVAHDILIDPDCRTDYDLRSLGILTSDITEEQEPSLIAYGMGKGPKSKSPSWRIGELLQAVGLLEQAELTIACDMHKAMPEMQFGRFLIKQDFLNETQLEAVLIGQVLLRSGDITLNQFINAMAELSKTNRNFKEILLESGYLKNATLLKLDNDI